MYSMLHNLKPQHRAAGARLLQQADILRNSIDSRTNSDMRSCASTRVHGRGELQGFCRCTKFGRGERPGL